MFSVLQISRRCDVLKRFSKLCNELRAKIRFLTSAFQEIDQAICWILEDLYGVTGICTSKHTQNLLFA